MKTYKVKRGETPRGIAKRFYGDAGHYWRILKANRVKDANRLEEGTDLNIPDVQEQPHEDPGSSGAAMGEAITQAQLQQIMPGAAPENIVKYLAPLNLEMPKFEINTPLRIAHFIAQVAHESGSFSYNTEKLNYSAKALRAVFGKYVPTDELAEAYAHKPEKIANRVYSNRMGNGTEESGDGWKYRGRGLIQLTGRDNYRHCGQGIGLNLEEDPDQVANYPVISVIAVGWFWKTNNLNLYADADDVKKITRRINGGYNGLEDRMEFLERAKRVLSGKEIKLEGKG